MSMAIPADYTSDYCTTPNCPYCGVELTDRGGDCADDDSECDCDQSWKCDRCDKWFKRPCPAHIDRKWTGGDGVELEKLPYKID